MGCLPPDDRAEIESIRDRVHHANRVRIERADFVFAYINEVDCFGTIAEIGFASARGIPVFICFGPDLDETQRDDLWFVRRFAVKSYDADALGGFVRAYQAWLDS